MSRKDQMKNALRALQVSQPYKLKQPSSWTSPDQTEKEVPHTEAPQVSQSKSVAPRNEGSHIEAAHNERPLSAEAGRVTTPSRAQTTDSDEAAQKEEPHSEPAPNEVPQNERTQSVDAQSEPPQFEAPEDRVSETAFFKLSHRVFSDPKLKKMSGDCFRLFLWMAAKAWRYPNSEGTVRASISFIEEGTGMSHANVSRCLKALKELDLVRLVHMDFKRGNVWWVSPLACPSGGGSGGRGLPRKEAPQFEAAQDNRGAASKSERTSHKTRAEVPRSEGEIKKLRKQNKTQKGFEVPVPSKPADTVSPEEYHLAEERFETSLDEESRQNLVERYISTELPHGFLPPQGVLNRLVAYDWFRRSWAFSSSNSQTRATA